MFLSVISFYGSTIAMNNPFSVVLSDIKVKVGTFLVATACASGTFLAKSGDNVDGKHVIVTAGVGAVSAIGAYLCLHQLTSEEQLKRCETMLQSMEKSKILKHQKTINGILATKNKDDLSSFVNREFGKHVETNSFASIGAINESNELEKNIRCGRHLLKKIQNSDDTQEEQVNALLEQLKDNKDFVKKFRGAILNLGEYEKDVKTHARSEYTEIKKQQYSFMNRVGAFVPMFVQPVSTLCMVLLQVIFNKLGIK